MLKIWLKILLFVLMYQSSISFPVKEEESDDLNPFNITNEAYQALDSETKQNMWWELIMATEGTAETSLSLGPAITNHLLADLAPACDESKDYRPFNFDRVIHQEGAVAKIEFTVDDNNTSTYSGIFESGSTNGIARLSGALGVTQGLFAPTIALKFFRNGMESGNLIFGSDAIRTDDFRFFNSDQMSHFHKGGIVATLIFARVDVPWNMVGSADVAMYDQNGTETDELSFPYEIVLKPTNEIQEIFGVPLTREEYINSMKQIPESTVLYEMYARDHSDTVYQDLIRIGSVKTTSPMVFSANADQYLFFRHSRMSTDLELGDETWSSSILCPMTRNLFDV